MRRAIPSPRRAASSMTRDPSRGGRGGNSSPCRKASIEPAMCTERRQDPELPLVPRETYEDVRTAREKQAIEFNGIFAYGI